MSKVSEESVLSHAHKEAPASYQEVFDKMDAYRRGEITLEQYRTIPRTIRMAARDWRIQRANRMLAERYPEVNLSSDI